MSDIDSSKTDNWHRDVVNKLAFAAVNEQRRARRWSIFYKGLLALYLVAIFVVYLPSDWSLPASTSEKHTALVEL